MTRSLLLPCAVLAGLTLLLASTPAHADPTTHVFVAVDRYEVDWANAEIEVTGVLENEPAPRAVVLSFYTYSMDLTVPLERCEKLALLAMSSPGRFKLEVRTEHEFRCALERIKP